jgi:hypothetical protein
MTSKKFSPIARKLLDDFQRQIEQCKGTISTVDLSLEYFNPAKGRNDECFSDITTTANDILLNLDGDYVTNIFKNIQPKVEGKKIQSYENIYECDLTREESTLLNLRYLATLLYFMDNDDLLDYVMTWHDISDKEYRELELELMNEHFLFINARVPVYLNEFNFRYIGCEEPPTFDINKLSDFPEIENILLNHMMESEFGTDIHDNPYLFTKNSHGYSIRFESGPLHQIKDYEGARIIHEILVNQNRPLSIKELTDSMVEFHESIQDGDENEMSMYEFSNNTDQKYTISSEEREERTLWKAQYKEASIEAAKLHSQKNKLTRIKNNIDEDTFQSALEEINRQISDNKMLKQQCRENAGFPNYPDEMRRAYDKVRNNLKQFYKTLEKLGQKKMADHFKKNIQQMSSKLHYVASENFQWET